MWLQEKVDAVDGNMLSDTVKSFIVVAHLILCISWEEQAKNLRSERNSYSLYLFCI